MRETQLRREVRILFADLIPTVAHLPLPWIMGYDLYPMTTLENNKKKWIPQVVHGEWLALIWSRRHDAGRVSARKRGPLGARTRKGAD